MTESPKPLQGKIPPEEIRKEIERLEGEIDSIRKSHEESSEQIQASLAALEKARVIIKKRLPLLETHPNNPAVIERLSNAIKAYKELQNNITRMHEADKKYTEFITSFSDDIEELQKLLEENLDS
ncbi:MAG: hypothetical protein AAB605_03400 [Patescibacteria group bacterium]